jgi:L-lysine 2,3-aminomutase
MWSELDITRILDHLARRDHRDVVRFSDRALVLVANRLTTPGSELCWRSAWRATSSAIALAGASSPAGETTPSAKPAGRPGFLRRKVHEYIAQR